MNQKEKILITGASGFVGGFLVETALKYGLDVYAALRQTSSRKYLTDSRINFVNIDLSDEIELIQLIKDGQYDYIIQNAGLTRSKKSEQLFKVNAESITNFVRAICASGVQLKKFTFISSMAAYGPADFTITGIVDDTHSPHPITAYGESKLRGEDILKLSDLPYTIIRPTAVYGPREKDMVTLYKTVQKGISAHIGLKDQCLTFIHVKDLARAIIEITLNADALKKEYFASDGNTYTTKQLMQYVQKHLGRRATTIKIPIALFKLIGAVSEFIGKLTGTFPPLNREKVNELGAKSWNLDAQPFWDAVSFTPKFDLDKGLEETIKWNKQHSKL